VTESLPLIAPVPLLLVGVQDAMLHTAPLSKDLAHAQCCVTIVRYLKRDVKVLIMITGTDHDFLVRCKKKINGALEQLTHDLIGILEGFLCHLLILYSMVNHLVGNAQVI